MSENEATKTFADYFGVLIRKKLFIIGFTAAAGALSVGYSMLLTKTYRTETQLLPVNSASSAGSGLGSVSALLGIGNMGAAQDPSQLFTDIVKSRRFKDTILAMQFHSVKLGMTAPLSEIFPVKAKKPELAKFTLWDMLDDMIEIKIQGNGIINIFVETIEPELAAHLADSVVSVLDRLNRRFKTEKTLENTTFIARNLSVSETALEGRRRSIKNFLASNINPTTPALLDELEWLKLQASFEKERYLLLKKEYEMSLLEGQKDMPMLTVLDKAITPAFANKPKKKKIVALTTIMAFCFSVFLAFFMEWLSTGQSAALASESTRRTKVPV